MHPLESAVVEVADNTDFSGAIRVEQADQVVFSAARGFADRSFEIPIAAETQFATASMTKGLTALVVMSLVDRGILGLAITARSILGDDLPLIADDVTVEDLLAHRSGIGDYLHENASGDITDHVLPVSVHLLESTEQYVPILGGHPTVFRAGERFAYNNAGYVVLALIAERAAATDFHELVRVLVCEPAGMVDTRFIRGDELTGRTARGYLAVDGLRTNVLHLPVRGSGDGGSYSTLADLSAFWRSLFAGRIVRPELVADMIRPRSDWPQEGRRYGLGFHLHRTNDAVFLEGYDAGVSVSSLHQPSTSVTYTVLSNWSNGAWPIVKVLNEQLGL